TLFMTLLGAWAALMSRLSGQDEVVVGTPVANRPRVELEGVIGFFVNTLALRIDAGRAPSTQALLASVRATALSAYDHQDLPFDRVVDAAQPQRSLGHAPVFQTQFVLESTDDAPVLGLHGLLLQSITSPHANTQFDLTLMLREEDGALTGSIEYASDLFDEDTI
ncbi:hypothetical protein LTR23_011298, partial [Exophiala sp. CCFEE 6169]